MNSGNDIRLLQQGREDGRSLIFLVEENRFPLLKNPSGDLIARLQPDRLHQGGIHTARGHNTETAFLRVMQHHRDVTRSGLPVDRIKQQVRQNTTPRHVPARVLQVADIPRTKSGKILELAVRNVVHGRPVKNIEALANPEALAGFRDRPELSC